MIAKNWYDAAGGDVEMQTWEIIAGGMLGGALPDLLRLFRGRHEGAPAWLKTWFFWIMGIGLVLLGGVVAYFSAPSTWPAAIALGFSAPEILSRLAGGGDADMAAEDSEPFLNRVRRWWAY